MLREIFIPQWVNYGIRRSRKLFKSCSVIGGDTETVRGLPYTFQLFTPKRQALEYVSSRNIFERFLNCLDSFTSDEQSFIYFHNLEFDLPILFYPFLQYFRDSQFTLSSSGFKAEFLYGKVNHCNIWLGNKRFELIDSFAYFKTSLANVAKMLGVEEKLKKPRKIGEIKYTGKEKTLFEKYAMRDAVITYHAGMAIQEWHSKEEISNSISAPQMAAKIFKQLIPVNCIIPANPPELSDAAVLSYHGGKNLMTCEPGIYKNVYLYDINSAYPYAFTMLPNFLNCDYDYISGNSKLAFRKRQSGIYNISGHSGINIYNPLRDHNFKVVTGDFSEIWVTSYELETMLRHKMLREYQIHEAFVVIPKERFNPLKEFALKFYSLKQKSSGVEREFYKIILNSLYGKFVQSTTNNLDEDVNNETVYQAGGLWNPLLGSLITGYVRAYLTELEIKWKSLHSSTDSIMTQKKINTSTKLGDISLKEHGTALILRPKFYLIWNQNKNITSYATHGYHGYLPPLISMLRSGKRKYSHRHMTKIKESYIQKKKPFIMETLFKTINIPITGKLSIPKLTYKGKRI